MSSATSLATGPPPHDRSRRARDDHDALHRSSGSRTPPRPIRGAPAARPRRSPPSPPATPSRPGSSSPDGTPDAAVAAAYDAARRPRRHGRPRRRGALLGHRRGRPARPRSPASTRRCSASRARPRSSRRVAACRASGRVVPRAGLPPRQRPARRRPPSCRCSSSCSCPPTPRPSSSASTPSPRSPARCSSTPPSGLGESIVGGTVTPDEWALARPSLDVRRRTIADKRRMTVRAPGGSREVDVPAPAAPPALARRRAGARGRRAGRAARARARRARRPRARLVRRRAPPACSAARSRPSTQIQEAA